jgi:hypothetical protein
MRGVVVILVTTAVCFFPAAAPAEPPPTPPCNPILEVCGLRQAWPTHPSRRYAQPTKHVQRPHVYTRAPT